MGDLISAEVSGRLVFVPHSELERLLRHPADRFERARFFADACRLNALYMIARAGSGHIGSSFSSLDMVAYLHLEVLSREAANCDLYFSSKGHDAPGLYAVLLGLGRLPPAKIHELRRLGGLPGHPDVRTPEIVANTGSLGMGISKAKGLALARRRQNLRGRIYVLTGDGELQEGQIWESLISAVNQGLSEITVIVDHNKLQSDTFVERTSALGDIEAKFSSFGLHVERVDGHDLNAFDAALTRVRANRDRPQVIIADTIKGRGVSFMEHTSLDAEDALYRFHSGAPDAETYSRAAEELARALLYRAERLGFKPLELTQVDRPQVPTPTLAPQSLIPSYADALLAEMADDPRLIALDADLALDTGQGKARERFPERAIECGIAEMDMVSMAGGMALAGLLPICHSFASFLSTRPNEQIYNNASEGTKVVYVTSLAGLLPAGPGHSHQSLRDISTLGSIPDLVMLAPGSPAEVHPALRALLSRERGSGVLRLETMPVVPAYELPRDFELEEGVGFALAEASDFWIIGYGPLLLGEALRAARLLKERSGLLLGVLNLPWLNRVERAWLARAIGRASHVFTLDNHYVRGGQGELVAATLAASGFERPPRVHCFGIESFPQCGQAREVLAHHRLDAESLAERVHAALRG
jgi:transketolase